MIALPVRNCITTLSSRKVHWNFFLAFYGYFFDLLAAGDIIPPTHPSTRCRGFSDFGFSTSCRDIPSLPHATIARPGFTCNTMPF